MDGICLGKTFRTRAGFKSHASGPTLTSRRDTRASFLAAAVLIIYHSEQRTSSLTSPSRLYNEHSRGSSTTERRCERGGRLSFERSATAQPGALSLQTKAGCDLFNYNHRGCHMHPDRGPGLLQLILFCLQSRLQVPLCWIYFSYIFILDLILSSFLFSCFRAPAFNDVYL